MKGYIVYCYTNRATGKKYIGATSKSLDERAGKSGEQYRGSSLFYSAILEYGWDMFDREILFSELTREQAAIEEARLIHAYQTRDSRFGYNQNLGGYVRYDLPEDERIEKAQQISKTLKKQRSSGTYRKIMSRRMKDVWADPVRRKNLVSRDSSRSGKKPVTVFCEETGELYRNLHVAAISLNVRVSVLCTLYKKRSAVCNGYSLAVMKPRTGRFKGIVLHLKFNMVDVKESELLGRS